MIMTIPIEERKAYVATFPWIRELKRPAPCQGWHGQSRGKRACKNLARWSYRHLTNDFDDGRTRRYCLNHLFSQGIYGSMEDEARTERWMKAHPPTWGDS
jgi:hypothetical protein